VASDWAERCYVALVLDTDAEYAEVISALSGVLARDPSNVPALNHRGLAYLETGRVAEAHADFDAAVRLAIDDYLPLMVRGLTRERAGDAAGAIADYSKAIEIDPSRGPWVFRARQHESLGLKVEALADYERAVELGNTRAISDRDRLRGEIVLP